MALGLTTAVLTLALGNVSPAQALDEDLSSLIRHCEHAVVGTVASVTVIHSEQGAAATAEIHLAVTEDLKGNAPLRDGILTIMEPARIYEQDADDPMSRANPVSVGDELLVFTEVAENGRIWVYGGDRGRFTFWAVSPVQPVESEEPSETAQAHIQVAISELDVTPDLVAETRQLAIQLGYTPVVSETLVSPIEPAVLEQDDEIDDTRPEQREQLAPEPLRPSEPVQARADVPNDAAEFPEDLLTPDSSDSELSADGMSEVRIDQSWAKRIDAATFQRLERPKPILLRAITVGTGGGY